MALWCYFSFNGPVALWSGSCGEGFQAGLLRFYGAFMVSKGNGAGLIPRRGQYRGGGTENVECGRISYIHIYIYIYVCIYILNHKFPIWLSQPLL